MSQFVIKTRNVAVAVFVILVVVDDEIPVVVVVGVGVCVVIVGPFSGGCGINPSMVWKNVF